MDRADVYELILTLTVRSKYLASDLYAAYCRIARKNGREPASHHMFGRVMNRVGCERRKMGSGAGVRLAWLVTGEARLNAQSGAGA